MFQSHPRWLKTICLASLVTTDGTPDTLWSESLMGDTLSHVWDILKSNFRQTF